MNEENAPTAETVGGVGSYSLNKFKVADGDQSVKGNSVAIYPGKGFRTYKLPGSVPTNGGTRGIREKIAGWSSASRRRMREFMLTNQPQNGPPYGVTLTVPGPVLTPEQAKRIFVNFARDFEEKQGAAVWRVEKQKRRQLHWHLMATMPAAEIQEGWSSPYSAEELDGYRRAKVRRAFFHDTVLALWTKAVDSLGPFPELRWKDRDGKTKVVYNCTLSMIPGFHFYGVDTQAEGDGGAWLRYLQDHCTKAKQEQIASGIGRHWGIIGRARFEKLLPSEIVALNDSEYFRFLRAWQRLATPSRKVPCVFGSKLGYRIQRGNRGGAVWFSASEITMRRMLDYARSGSGRPLDSDLRAP
jgi:hypothetical protein